MHAEYAHKSGVRMPKQNIRISVAITIITIYKKKKTVAAEQRYYALGGSPV